MYISLNEIFVYIIFGGLIALIIVGIIALLRLNNTIKSIQELIENNKNNINNTCSDLPVITKNAKYISESIKDISDVVTEFTAEAIVTKDNIFNNIEILTDILKIIKSVFFN